MIQIFYMCATLLLIGFSNVGFAAEQDPAAVMRSLNWIKGPTTVEVGPNATFTVPAGYMFLYPTDTKRMMELLQNPSDGNETLFAPTDFRWFAVYGYADTGHVRDDEKIEPEPLLETIRRNTEESNKQRASRGWAQMTIVGWRYPPFYDPETKRLDWAIDGRSGDQTIINYNTRILGRTGVTSAVLVAEPAILATAVPEFKTAVAGYAYKPGHKYSEFKQGDRMAEYGLAALIAGGAAAVATKKGFWAVIASFIAAGWKVIAAVVVGVIVWLGSLFKRNRNS